MGDQGSVDGKRVVSNRTKGKPDQQRRTHQATLVQFIEMVRQLVPGAQIDGTKGAMAQNAIGAHPPVRSIWISADTKEIVCFLSGGQDRPSLAARIIVAGGCTEHQLTLLRTFTKVFDTDIASAPWMGRDLEAWESLNQTRFTRVIARIATFRTSFFTRCLRTMEGARELTYEGQAFATRLLVANELGNIETVAKDRFRPLKKRLRLETAIFDEKWVRAFTSQGTIALVATVRRSTVAGVVLVPDGLSAPAEQLHASIGQVEAFVRDGVAMIAATQNGDIWVRLGNGMAFLRRRSRWQHFELSRVGRTLEPYLPEDVVDALLRLAMDASFDRRGALFGVLTDTSSIHELVPDRSSSSRSNRALRELVAGLNVADLAHRSVIRSAAMIDGAVFLDTHGAVLDAACIAVEPTQARREELGVTKWPSHAGARATAARNISVHGVSIKVSDDGPISVFIRGALVAEIG